MAKREAIHLLREIDPQVKAIVASGYSNDPVMARYEEYGFAGMVTKPFEPDELSEAIGKVLKYSRAESDIAVDCDQELLERKIMLKQAVLSLKPKYQTVITLRFFENMKLTEIAACMGKKPSTVRCWLSRATAKLRNKLDAARNNGGAIS